MDCGHQGTKFGVLPVEPLVVCSKTARAAPMGQSVRRLAADLRAEPAVARVAREFRSTLLGGWVSGNQISHGVGPPGTTRARGPGIPGTTQRRPLPRARRGLPVERMFGRPCCRPCCELCRSVVRRMRLPLGLVLRRPGRSAWFSHRSCPVGIECHRSHAVVGSGDRRRLAPQRGQSLDARHTAHLLLSPPVRLDARDGGEA